MFSPPSKEVAACIVAIDIEPIFEYQTSEYLGLASMKRSDSTREVIRILRDNLQGDNYYWLKYVDNGNHWTDGWV